MKKYEFNSKLFSKKENRKIKKVEIIEDSDEYFVMYAIIIQDTQKINPNLNDKARSIPR